MTAPCVMGLESLVAEELRNMGAQKVAAQNGRVFFEGDESILARANLNLRYAERVLIVLGSFRADTFDLLYQGVRALPWSDYIGVNDAFPVKGHSVGSALFSIPDCQKIVKRAIVDSLNEKYGVSWFEETGPLHAIQFLIFNNTATVMLDTTGLPLHMRGYRAQSNDAPIRETLAAAMCRLLKLRGSHILYDPCCGSGTILIEGAMIANNIAPGINREFSCQKWEQLDQSVWKPERERCRDLQKRTSPFIAVGSDVDAHALELASNNAAIMGVDKFIELKQASITDFTPTTEKGTLVTNPPYGERMLDEKSAQGIYRVMGKRFEIKEGWAYGIISPDEEFEKHFGREATKRRKLYNGMIKCTYYMYYNQYNNNKQNFRPKKKKTASDK